MYYTGTTRTTLMPYTYERWNLRGIARLVSRLVKVLEPASKAGTGGTSARKCLIARPGGILGEERAPISWMGVCAYGGWGLGYKHR